ncbi:MAG TPA: hypothetical protein VGJ25_09070 [Gaiellaceae bacterium]|jgi:hypothetical protein
MPIVLATPAPTVTLRPLTRGVQYRLQSGNPNDGTDDDGTGNHARTDWWKDADQKIDLTALGPNPADTWPLTDLFAIHCKWANLEQAQGVFWPAAKAAFDATAAYCRTRSAVGLRGTGTQVFPLKFVPRIQMGIGGPYGYNRPANPGCPSWGTHGGAVPILGLGAGFSPYHWNPQYQADVSNFWRNVFGAWLRERDGWGGYKGDQVAWIPISGPGAIANNGTEMNLQYTGAGDLAIWDAISGFYPAGLSSGANGQKEAYRRLVIEKVWRDMVAKHMADLPSWYAAWAFGGVFSDNLNTAKRMLVGGQVSNGTINAVAAGETTVNFTGTSHLGSRTVPGCPLDGTLYDAAGNVLGQVADVLSDTRITLKTAARVGVAGGSAYSVEISPLPFYDGRLIVMCTNFELDPQSRDYGFEQSDHAEVLRSARLRGFPIVTQAQSYPNYQTDFPTNYRDKFQESVEHAFYDYGSLIFECSDVAYNDGNNGDWLSIKAKQIYQQGAVR